jgi:hypothetical protein
VSNRQTTVERLHGDPGYFGGGMPERIGGGRTAHEAIYGAQHDGYQIPGPGVRATNSAPTSMLIPERKLSVAEQIDAMLSRVL